MASTYSTNLALELIGTGDQAGTWGTTTNTNLGTLLEQAISGYQTQAITDGADTTITIPNGSSGVARNMFIEMTGALTAARNLIVPANKKLYFIYNNTTGGFAVTVKVSGQTGVSVPNGAKVVLVSNGTDIVAATSYMTSLTVGGSATANSFIPNSSTVPTNGMYLPATNTLGWAVNSAAAMRLDSLGNLGLGVTPATGVAGYNGLQIGNAALYGRTGNTTNSELYLYANSTIDDKYIGTDYAAALTTNDGMWTFKTAASGTAGNAISWTTAMSLTSIGGLSVTGTLGTGGQVSVVSDVSIGYVKSLAVTAGASVAAIVSKTVTYNYPNHSAWNAADAGDNIWHYFIEGSGGNVRGSIDFNRGGTLTRYNTTSDKNLKNLIGDAPQAKSLSILSNTRLREFSWKNDDTNKPQIGVIAQELYEVFPGAVSVGGDYEVVDEDGKAATKYKPWSVDKTAYQYHLVAGWQNHESRIAAIEAKLLGTK